MAKQNLIPAFQSFGVKEFGGSLLGKANARERRPISTKRPMHLVLRSSLAKGSYSFLRPERARKIKRVVEKTARRSNLKLYRYANSGNHLHLLILPPSRKAFHRFVRVISGLIARMTLGRERGKENHGKNQAQRIKFWDLRPYSKIMKWGREFRFVTRYLLQNTLEALGFIPYQTRRRRPQIKFNSS